MTGAAPSQSAVYGAPPAALAPVGADALQVSPWVPGAGRLEALADGSLDRIWVVAPAGAVERRYVLAQVLRILRPGGELTALAPKARGGLRLAGELAAFGCAVAERSKHHQRICICARPPDPPGLAEAIQAGGPQLAPRLALFSQPGIFSWDRVDAGSAALIASDLTFKGRGADLGCGLGLLALEILKSPGVSELTLVDLDRRAVEAARRNIDDARARILHADATAFAASAGELDFIVMNPPFHDEHGPNTAQGQAFINAAARLLHPGGRLRMVANVALPYEAALGAAFKTVRELGRTGGYKIHEAIR